MSPTDCRPAVSPACQHVGEGPVAEYEALVRAALADMQGALGWPLDGVAYAYTVGISTRRGLIRPCLAEGLQHENATACVAQAVETWRDEIHAGAGTLTLTLAKTGKVTAKFVRHRAS